MRGVIAVKIEPASAEIYGPPLHVDHLAIAFAGLLGMSYAAVSADYAACMGRDVVAIEPRRAGKTHFTDEVLDALAAAGVIVEDRADGGVVLNLPSGGGRVDGIGLAQMMTKRLSVADFDHIDMASEPPRPQNYLRHDPTKNHRRRRGKR